jgi:hypothetical protein
MTRNKVRKLVAYSRDSRCVSHLDGFFRCLVFICQVLLLRLVLVVAHVLIITCAHAAKMAVKMAKRGKLVNRTRKSAAESSRERVASKVAKAQGYAQQYDIDFGRLQVSGQRYCEDSGHYVPAHRTCDKGVVICEKKSSHSWWFKWSKE